VTEGYVGRPFRLLWTARTVSFLGDALSLVALMLHVAETTGQALAVATLLLASFAISSAGNLLTGWPGPSPPPSSCRPPAGWASPRPLVSTAAWQS